MAVLVIVFLVGLVQGFEDLAAKTRSDFVSAPQYFHFLSPPPIPPPPMFYSSPPPPLLHFHKRHHSPPPPHHHHDEKTPPPPIFYRSPPPPLLHSGKHSPPPPTFYRSPPPPHPPCLPTESTNMKLAIQGKALVKTRNATSTLKRLKGARVRVGCSTTTDEMKESYGRTDANGKFKVMVSGLEVGKVEINKCVVELIDYNKPMERDSYLMFKLMSMKEIVLQSTDLVYSA